jgi:hypothetical protein
MKTVQKLKTGNDYERLQSAAETSIHKHNQLTIDHEDDVQKLKSEKQQDKRYRAVLTNVEINDAE